MRSEEVSGTDEARAADGQGRDEPEVITSYRGTGVSALLIGMLALVVFGIVFLAQNTESVPIEFLNMDVEAPLFVVVLIAAAASSAVTLLVAELWRRRRRRQRTEREELQRLRRRRS